MYVFSYCLSEKMLTDDFISSSTPVLTSHRFSLLEGWKVLLPVSAVLS